LGFGGCYMTQISSWFIHLGIQISIGLNTLRTPWLSLESYYNTSENNKQFRTLELSKDYVPWIYCNIRTQVMTLNLIQDLGLQSKSRILHSNESLRPQDYVSNYGDSEVL